VTPKTYCAIGATLFALVAAGHLLRLVAGWDVTIAGWAVPRWISVVGLVVPGALSAWGFSLASRGGPSGGG
jgi:hypothetical protein